MLPTVVLTRPAEQSADFAATLLQAAPGPVPIVISPLMTIEHVALGDIGRGDLILTSAHGVAAARRLGFAAGTVAWCVGPQTAHLARDAGFAVHEGAGTAEDLLALIQSQAGTQPLIHLHGRHTRGDLCQRLNAAGYQVTQHVAYDQTESPLTAQAQQVLSGTAPVIAPLFSPRTALIFVEAGPFTAPVTVVAISKAVADQIPADWDIHLAPSPDAGGMQQAVLDLIYA